MSAPDPRYPIGPFAEPSVVGEDDRDRFVSELEALPDALRGAVGHLTEAQLDTPYRDGGWTVRQVVHHLPDSHMNSYVRMRLALTEEEPTIRPYAEDRWARLPDSLTAPIAPSLDLLSALHVRWVYMSRRLGRDQWIRRFRHPDRGVVSLETNLALYAWHGRHHLAQIVALSTRLGWS